MRLFVSNLHFGALRFTITSEPRTISLMVDGHPTDNQPQITEAIRSVLMDDYNYDSTVRPFPLARLPRTYLSTRHLTDCVFD